MTELTPTEIAKQWRVSKTTVYKHINKGRMSYRTDEDGHKLVDLSEVVRVLGEPKKSSNQSTSTDSSLEISFLKKQVEKLEQDLIYNKEEKQKDKEFFQSLIETQNQQIADALNGIKQLMIEHKTEPEKEEPILPPAPESTPTPEPMPEEAIQEIEQPKKKRGLFTRLIAAAIDD